MIAGLVAKVDAAAVGPTDRPDWNTSRWTDTEAVRKPSGCSALASSSGTSTE